MHLHTLNNFQIFLFAIFKIRALTFYRALPMTALYNYSSASKKSPSTLQTGHFSGGWGPVVTQPQTEHRQRRLGPGAG
jgi:hypothetical protein